MNEPSRILETGTPGFAVSQYETSGVPPLVERAMEQFSRKGHREPKQVDE